tara:strand:+ start:418 stop:1050 length:633 start_codon:yes stop_codon:yes gene_type:complete
MGFTQLGTLQYLSLNADATGLWPHRGRQGTNENSGAREQQNVIAIPLDATDATQMTAFEDLVERTYVDSLDCPPLVQFRTAQDIVRNYRSVETYSPDLWYTVAEVCQAGDEPSTIGCVILARHPAPSASQPAQINPACVIELVYMGIIPEYRGRDYGKAIIRMITKVCQQHGTERLILAVDQANPPALAIYRRSGMLPLFRETVWGRSAV